MDWLQVWAFMNVVGDLAGWLMLAALAGFVGFAWFLAKN